MIYAPLVQQGVHAAELHRRTVCDLGKCQKKPSSQRAAAGLLVLRCECKFTVPSLQDWSFKMEINNQLLLHLIMPDFYRLLHLCLWWCKVLFMWPYTPKFTIWQIWFCVSQVGGWIWLFFPLSISRLNNKFNLSSSLCCERDVHCGMIWNREKPKLIFQENKSLFIPVDHNLIWMPHLVRVGDRVYLFPITCLSILLNKQPLVPDGNLSESKPAERDAPNWFIAYFTECVYDRSTSYNRWADLKTQLFPN